MPQKSENTPPSILKQKKPWADNDHQIWLASTVSLARNIDKQLFPNKLDAQGQKQILSLVKSHLMSHPSLKKPVLYPANTISPTEKQFLVEHYLTRGSFHQLQESEGFITDESGRFLATVNAQDHLNLLALDITGEFENTWKNLVDIEMHVGEKITYAFSQRFGFLTTEPINCGTGLRVSVFLQLSGLIHTEKLDDLLEKILDEQTVVTGLHGNPDEIIGDILVVENNYSLGITEENILSNLRTICTKLHSEEQSARKVIKEKENPDIKDKISRAYAILTHSYQIEAVEALNALSLLKLGIAFEWIKGISVKQINQLFFNCRRAHLLHLLNEDIPQEELLHKRAEYIHSVLKKVELNV